MKLLGDRNWYLPSWLEWLPRVGAPEAAPEPAPSPAHAFAADRPLPEDTPGGDA